MYEKSLPEQADPTYGQVPATFDHTTSNPEHSRPET